MKGLRWQYVAALGVVVVGAVAAAFADAPDLAKTLGGAVIGLLGPARQAGGSDEE